MDGTTFLLGYFSPETVLPLTSIVATIVGAAMLLTRGSLRFLIRCVRTAIRRPMRIEGTGTPHHRSAGAKLSEKVRR